MHLLRRCCILALSGPLPGIFSASCNASAVANIGYLARVSLILFFNFPEEVCWIYCLPGVCISVFYLFFLFLVNVFCITYFCYYYYFFLSGTILFFYVLFFAVVPTVNYSIKGLPGAYTSLMTHVSVTIALATKQRKKRREEERKRENTHAKKMVTRHLFRQGYVAVMPLWLSHSLTWAHKYHHPFITLEAGIGGNEA